MEVYGWSLWREYLIWIESAVHDSRLIVLLLRMIRDTVWTVWVSDNGLQCTLLIVILGYLATTFMAFRVLLIAKRNLDVSECVVLVRLGMNDCAQGG